MSTKIYRAFRTKPDVDIFKLSAKIQKRGVKNAKGALTETYNNMRDAWLNQKDFRKVFCEVLGRDPGINADGNLSYLNISEYIHKQYGKQLASHQRDMFDLNVSVAIRKLDNRYYLIPFCSGFMHENLNFLDKMKELEEYGYWNNTDEPDEVTEEEWAERGENWDKLIERWQEMLVLEIVSYYGWFNIDPAYELARKETEARKNHAGNV